MKRNRFCVTLIICLALILSACNSADTESTQITSTNTVSEDIVLGEITTEEVAESTEQTEIGYQVEYTGGMDYKNRKEYFALFTNREDIEKLSGVSQSMNEKYDETWFESHSFVFILLGHCSCCFVDLYQVEFEENCLKVLINKVKKNQEDLYKEKGKDYERGTGGTHHDEAAIHSNFIIEFDKTGEEMLRLMQKLIYKVRDYPSASWHEGELRLRAPET